MCLRLAEWGEAVTHQARIMWPNLPEGIEDRLADVWEPLVVVADLAGRDWPQRSRVAAVGLVADVREENDDGQAYERRAKAVDQRAALRGPEQVGEAMPVPGDEGKVPV